MIYRTGVISNKQFMKHFGTDIFIHPFNKENLKGSSYNLTASRVAYYKNNDGKLISILRNKNKIIIPPKKLVFIQTEESIYVSKRICGTYHTKVNWVSRGLSSISTTLDPGYFGTSLMILNNLSNKEIELDVGESFCTLMLYKMASGDKDVHDNFPFRKDINSGKIYNFPNTFKYQEAKRTNELERLMEVKKSKKYFDKTEEGYILKNIKNAKEELDTKFSETNYGILKINEEIRKEKLIGIELEYKNYLEEWFEEGFRRNKETLINIVQMNVRIENKERIDSKISAILVFIYIIIFSMILNVEPVSKLLLDKEINLKFSEKLTVLSIAIPGVTFVHDKFINFGRVVWYTVNKLCRKKFFD